MKQLYLFAKANIKNVSVEYISCEEIQHAQCLVDRFEAALWIPGCPDQRFFKPVSTSAMRIYKISPLPGKTPILSGYTFGDDTEASQSDSFHIGDHYMMIDGGLFLCWTTIMRKITSKCNS